MCQFSVKKLFSGVFQHIFTSKQFCNIEERLFEKLGLNDCIFSRVGDGDGDDDDDGDDAGDDGDNDPECNDDDCTAL